MRICMLLLMPKGTRSKVSVRLENVFHRAQLSCGGAILLLFVWQSDEGRVCGCDIIGTRCRTIWSCAGTQAYVLDAQLVVSLVN